MVRRGQVALEFLTTYGWALMIILVMIGAISYFGVMNPSKLLPSKCTVGSELSCEDYQILNNDDGTTTVSLQMKQSVGRTIYLGEFACSYQGEDSDPVDLSGLAWSPGDPQTFSCDLNEFVGLERQKVKVLYEVTYQRSLSGFTHLVAGELYTEVQ